MFFYEGLSCPVCKRAFTKNEDIVVCPQCGLPHHRECWKQLSHCHQADKHGTDEQWSREKAKAPAEPQKESSEDFSGKICPRCHTRNKEFAEFCTHCCCQLPSDDWHSAVTPPPVGEYTPFHAPYAAGEIYTDTELLDEAATAKDVAAVVGTNTAYYIPRFRRIKAGEKSCWNWAAFVLFPYWLLYRKQYAIGIPVLVVQTFFSILGNYWSMPITLAATEEELIQAMNSVLSHSLTVPIMAISLILLVARIALGLYGNALYRQFCVKKIRSAREKTPDLSSAELASVGGTSMLAAMLCYFIPYVILNITMLVMNL